LAESSEQKVAVPPKLGMRLLAAAVLVPGFIFITHVGDWLFAATVAVVALRLLWEFTAMSRARGHDGFFAFHALPVLAILAAFWQLGLEGGMICFAALVMLGFCAEALRGRIENATARIGERMIVLFYLGVLPGHWLLLRELPLEVGLPYHAGRDWALFGAGITWLGDTFAYLVGSVIGRHPLGSSVSPRKSVEGVIAGLLGSLLTAWFFARYWAEFLNLWQILAVGMLVAVVGQMGDLFESLLKRDAAVKDSGSIIPGHGGFLDRVDSLLFSFTALYYFLRWVIF
jgi:phosphatidate cytidylyltransferase